MSNTKDFIIEELRKRIDGFKSEAGEKTFGRVISVGDGIARVSGLGDAMMSEMLEFKTETGSRFGVVLNLEEDSVGAVICRKLLRKSLRFAPPPNGWPSTRRCKAPTPI